MTVRVRQLSRVSSGRIPPIPPVVPTMSFIQQPTDTLIDEPFVPPIAVRVSDDAPGDQLVLTMNSGPCTVQSVSALTDVTGIAIFTGVTAGSVAAEGCTLRVHNLTRPSIEDIISETFNTRSPVVIPEWSLVTSVQATSTDLRNIDVYGVNTSGAQLIVVIPVTYMTPQSPIYVYDGLQNTYQPQNLFTLGYRYWQLQAFVAINPNVGPNHNFHVRTYPTTDQPSYPDMIIMAFNSGGGPVSVAIEGPSYGNVVEANSITSAAPANIDFDGGLAITGFTGWESADSFTITPNNYTIIESTYLRVGFRQTMNPSVEQPLWTIPISLRLLMNLLVFRNT